MNNLNYTIVSSEPQETKRITDREKYPEYDDFVSGKIPEKRHASHEGPFDPDLEEKDALWSYIKEHYPDTVVTDYRPDLSAEQFRAWAEYGDPRAFHSTRYTDQRNLIESANGHSISDGTAVMPSLEYSNVRDINLMGRLLGHRAKYRAYRIINSKDPTYHKKKLIRELLDQLPEKFHAMKKLVSPREIAKIAAYSSTANFYQPSVERLLVPFIISKAQEAGIAVQNREIIDELGIWSRPRIAHYREILEQDIFAEDLSRDYEVYEDMARTWIYKMQQSSFGNLVKYRTREMITKVDDILDLLPELKFIKKNLSEVIAVVVLKAQLANARLKDIAIQLAQYCDAEAHDLFLSVKRLDIDFLAIKNYHAVVEQFGQLSTPEYVHQPMKLGSALSIMERNRMIMEEQYKETMGYEVHDNDGLLMSSYMQLRKGLRAAQVSPVSPAIPLPDDLSQVRQILSGMEGELARAIIEILQQPQKRPDGAIKLVLNNSREMFKYNIQKIRGLDKLNHPSDIDELLESVNVIEHIDTLDKLIEVVKEYGESESVLLIDNIEPLIRQEIRSQMLETGIFREYLLAMMEQDNVDYIELCKLEIMKKKEDLEAKQIDKEIIRRQIEEMTAIFEQKIREFRRDMQQRNQRWIATFRKDYQTYHATDNPLKKVELSAKYDPYIPESVLQKLDRLWKLLENRPHIVGYRTSRALNRVNEEFQYTLHRSTVTDRIVEEYLASRDQEIIFVNNVPNRREQLDYSLINSRRISELIHNEHRYMEVVAER